MYETIDLNWHQDGVTKLCSLEREDTPLISEVSVDEKVLKASESFDYDFDGKNKFYPFKFNNIIKNLDFQILVITGSSGAGKSVFSKYFGTEEQVDWDLTKSVISNFNSAEEGIERLCATGLSSIPAWCRPYNVLSVGEKFRADLARKLKSYCVIDEFTSTVNRETALSCSASISKYIRKNNLKHCVFVSCHKDFIDTLCPDYVIDLDDECVYDTRGLLRRKFRLSIYETEQKEQMWQIFKRHHYLTTDLNKACRMFIAYFDNIPVACCAILPQPGVHNLEGGVAYRIHRLVVLPDYQGLGIATKLLEYICDIYTYHGKVMYLRTSHVKLIRYMLNSVNWKGNGDMKHHSKQHGILASTEYNEKRLSASFKYTVPCKYVQNRNYDAIIFPKHEDKDENKPQIVVESLW